MIEETYVSVLHHVLYCIDTEFDVPWIQKHRRRSCHASSTRNFHHRCRTEIRRKRGLVRVGCDDSQATKEEEGEKGEAEWRYREEIIKSRGEYKKGRTKREEEDLLIDSIKLRNGRKEEVLEYRIMCRRVRDNNSQRRTKDVEGGEKEEAGESQGEELSQKRKNSKETYRSIVSNDHGMSCLCERGIIWWSDTIRSEHVQSR